MERSEGATALMQEEQVRNNAWTDDGRDGTEEAGKQTRHDVRDVLVRMRHDGSPDLADSGEDNAPEDDRAAAQGVGDGGEEEWSASHSGQSS